MNNLLIMLNVFLTKQLPEVDILIDFLFHHIIPYFNIFIILLGLKYLITKSIRSCCCKFILKVYYL